MYSSEDFTQSVNSAKIGGLDRRSKRDSASYLSADRLERNRAAAGPDLSDIRGHSTSSSARPTETAHESSSDQKLPPLPTAAVVIDHERKAVLMVEGEDTPARQRALAKRMSSVGAGRGRRLFIRCAQGEVRSQLVYAATWAAGLCARCPANPVIVGINAIDQGLTSPYKVAYLLQAILNVGAEVACAVDTRYVDSLLLVFHLRTLGIEVIHEPLDLTGSIRAYAEHKMPRLLSSAMSEARSRPFPRVGAPVPRACATELQKTGGQTTKNSEAGQPESKFCWPYDDAGHLAISEFERREHARAYRNGFAVNRLLRESFGL